jgi:hypothetical protein
MSNDYVNNHFTATLGVDGVINMHVTDDLILRYDAHTNMIMQ